MTSTIVITSGKGGVGKTNISVNTALELSQNDHKVCLLDADLGLANVNILLGLYPEKNLDDFIFGDIPLEDIVVQTEYGIDVIPGSSGVEQMANLDAGKLTGLVDGVSGLENYDYLLIDTSSGISRGVISFCLASADLLLVITPESTSLTDGYGLLKVLSLNGYQGNIKILVNKCANVPQAKKTFGHFKAVVERRLKLTVVPGGVILSDSTLEKAVSSQQPAGALYPKSTFSLCIKALVSNLVNKTGSSAGDESFAEYWTRYLEFLHSDLLLPGLESKVKAQREPVKEEPPQKKKEELVSQLELGDLTGPEDQNPAFSSQKTKEVSAPSTVTPLSTPLSLLSTVFDMQKRGELTAEGMGALIAHDPLFTLKALELYHPSGSELHTGVLSIEQLVTSLHEDVLAKLLLTSASHHLLKGSSVEKCIAVSKRWAHSVRCAMMAKELAELMDDPFPDAAYLAGLLHEVGEEDWSQESFQRQVPTGSTSDDHEKELELKVRSGVDYLSQLNLCSLVVDAIKYHSESEERVMTAFGMTKLVYVAHLLSTPEEGELTQGVHLATKLLKISTSDLFTSIQLVSQEFAKLAANYGISSNGEIDLEKVVDNLRHYRQQAIDYVTLECVLLLPPRPAIGHMVSAIHQGLSQMFGFNRVVCLIPDSKNLHLKAEGYPGCFSEEHIHNIQFSLHSQASLIVAAYGSESSRLLTSTEMKSLADKQVAALLHAENLLCLPLIHPLSKQFKGLLLCVLSEADLTKYAALQTRLENFATQVTLKLEKSIL